jgi:tetratricopeptide (TPR) repeat protein
MIAPLHLSIFYPYPQKVSLRLGILAATILVLISVAAFWRVRRFPWLFTGWLWYLGTLAPVIGIIQVGGQARADRYTYIPLIGLFVIIAWGACELFNKLPFRKTVSCVLAFSCVIVCAVFARTQLLHWKNSLTLFKNAVTVTKNNHMAHNNLGVAFFDKGNIDSAMRHYQESMRILPNDLAAYNQGVISGKKNELKKAIVYLNESIWLDSTYARAYLSLGEAYKLSGNDSLALIQFKKAILTGPDCWEAFHSLGIIRYSSDSLTKAISCFLRELEIRPQSWEAYNALGLAWSKKGDFQRSFFYLIQGIQICPDSSWEPYFNLGMILLKKGKLNSAKDLFSHAISLSPTQTLTYVNRAAVYVLQGNLDSAITDYSEILRLKPDMAFAHYHLGLVFEKKDQRDSSEAHFKKAYAIDPKSVAYGIKAKTTRARAIKRKI